MVLESR